MSTVTLAPVGDVELWYAEGEGQSWRLPFHVEWKLQRETDQWFALVLPGVCFYEIQLIAVRALLHGYAIDDKQDRWLMPKDELPTKLAKAPGINASFYYHWPSGVHPPIPARHHPFNLTHKQAPARSLEQYKDFAEFISSERQLPLDLVLMVLRSIGELGARWLLEKREPINFGFCKLIALPFRANWKEIVAFKLKPYSLGKVLSQVNGVRNKLLEQIGFPKVVCSLHNIGLRSMGERNCHRLGYTVETLVTPAFEREANRIESDRMKGGSTSYVGQFEWTVEKCYDLIIETMRQYLTKTWAPWAAVRNCSKTGLLTFAPRRKAGGKLGHGVSLDTIPVHIIPPDSRFSVFAEHPQESDATLLYPEAASLQALRVVPQKADDLRRRALVGDVDQPRSGRADGVSLLPPSQDNVAGG